MDNSRRKNITFIVAGIGFIIVAGLIGRLFANRPPTPPDRTRTSENQLARTRQRVESEYPAFKNWEAQPSFAGQTILSERDNTSWYHAYLVMGSGLPIVRGTCFRVDQNGRVYLVGRFPNPADSRTGYTRVNPKNCTGAG